KRDHSDSAMMTKEQWKAVLGSESAFWALQWLLRTGLEQTAEQVAAELRLPAVEAEKALAILTNHGLLKKSARGTFVCPYFEGDLSCPSGKLGGLENARRVWGHLQRRIEDPEQTRYNCGFAVMALEHADKQYPKLVSLMSEALWKCYLFRQGRRPFHG